MFFFEQWKGVKMNLIYAAESIVKSKIDEHGFIMNTCIHDQSSENLDKFLKALDSYQKAVAEYEIIQSLKNQVSNEAPVEVQDSVTNED